MVIFFDPTFVHVPYRWSPARAVGDVRRQQGGIVIMAAIFLSIFVILLSALDIGYLFFQKRDLQKVADLAALAGVQALSDSGLSCNAASLAANANAQSNNFSLLAPNTSSNAIVLTCGRWDPQTTPALTTVQTYEAPLSKNFGTPKSGINPNAIEVLVSSKVTGFFGLGTQSVVAQAVATQSNPVAAFSLGTGLLSLCSGSSALLAPLINGLLGSNVCLSAVTYNGLVNTQVSLLQVLKNLNLNVGNLNDVLNAQVSLAQLVNASVQALSPAQAASITVSDLAALTTGTLGGSLLTIGKILNISAADGVSALNTQINVLDLLNVGTLQVANSQHFINLGTNVDLGALGKVGIKLELIQPPQIAIGGVGPPATFATSAQMRLAINVQALTIIPGKPAVNLPLYVDLAYGKATLTSVQCKAPQSATFSVQPGGAQVCMANGQTDASAPNSCPSISNQANRVDVIPGLINLGINAQVANQQPTTVTLNAPFPSSVIVGSSLSSILGNVIQPGTFQVGLDILDPLGLLSGLLTVVLSGLGGLLNPILSAVGGLLDTTFSLLGLGVGQNTLKLSSVTCGNLLLVY
ncbi:pilus assembly protein TadG-related protein [Glaciimonas sp. Gout2]|uniref:pilus assembly protein TadG-related protein n=1 Tax=unclassified Glaciimonas TaxID=2644401 RepID=UPI002B237937|nr:MULTISPECIES: pilus assembly protein TadG-related protein [unclassified Glaciimonas]MEB0013061.1 pilus assembly protein TadG-related protein [Glaciimonas sp. Cout2]MEB0083628.1 pilus assembly protein TadG-related protein [Glaciimonas sp. Gout2]